MASEPDFARRCAKQALQAQAANEFSEHFHSEPAVRNLHVQVLPEI